MEKEQLIQKIRKKKLSILLKDARLPLERSIEECARIMAIEPEEYASFENGLKSPSLPQLEALAFYLHVPIDHFWNESSISQDFPLKDEEEIVQRNQFRNEEIGTYLRTTREDKDLSQEELALKSGVEAERISMYEEGEECVPLPELEALARALQLDIHALFDRDGKIGEWQMKEEANARFQDLSEEMRDFVSKPVNRPYLEIARRLSEFPTDKLRTLAESLLEITY